MTTSNCRTLIRLSTIAGLAAVVACSDSDSPVSNAGTYFGPSVAMGQGTARTFVETNAAGTDTALGISLTESALSGLPTATTPPDPAALLLTLTFPPEAAPAGFDHAEIQWNPQGHPPTQIYGVPHFDFHFYLVSMAEEKAILPTDPQYAAKAANFPPADFIPQGYVPPPGSPAENAVPQMGLHWSDTASPEFNGQPFTKTFIYGSWNGRFIFVEPMVTKAYLDTHPTDTKPVPQPTKWAIPASYPTTYSVNYDPTAKEYRIVLGGLTQRTS
jgi:uncharacterized protein